MNWKRPNPDHSGLIASAIAGGIEMMERDQRAVLPNLRSSRALGLACDFSGQHAESRFDTFAFLLFSTDQLSDWQTERLAIRGEMIRDERRIAYKNLRDNVRWNALEPFLGAAGKLDGVLLTLSIDKQFSPEFTFGPGLRAAEFEDLSRYDEWKVGSVVKAIQVVHTAAILVAGFAGPGQDLHWIIDHDEIVETSERQTVLGASFQDVISDYLTFDMGGFEIITPADDHGTLTVEDLLSVADLAAGAFADTFTTVRSAKDREHLQELLSTKKDRARKKAELIVEWCSQNTTRNLKYMNIALSPGDAEMPIYGMYIYPQPSA